MPRNSVNDWDTNADLNTDIDGVNIAENCPPSGINNAIRSIMGQISAFAGNVMTKAGGIFTGPIQVNGSITRDAGYGFDIVGGNPVFKTDALGASWWFDRTQGFHNFQAGVNVNGSVGADGYINARVGMRAGGNTVWHAGNLNKADLAPINSPGLTGKPTTPTPPSGTADFTIANCAFVMDVGNSKASLSGAVFTGDVFRAPNFGFILLNGNPAIVADSDLTFLAYDKSTRRWKFFIGNSAVMSVDAQGNIRALGDIIAGIAP
jgi:hypothetical protein